MNYFKKNIKYLFCSFCIYFVFLIINLLMFKFPDNDLNKLENFFFILTTYIPIIVSCAICMNLANISRDLDIISSLLGGIFSIGGNLLIYLGLYIALGLLEETYNIMYLKSGIYTFLTTFAIIYFLFIVLILLLKHVKTG